MADLEDATRLGGGVWVSSSGQTLGRVRADDVG